VCIGFGIVAVEVGFGRRIAGVVLGSSRRIAEVVLGSSRWIVGAVCIEVVVTDNYTGMHIVVVGCTAVGRRCWCWWQRVERCIVFARVVDTLRIELGFENSMGLWRSYWQG
jgi:hypothetical protein